MMDLTTKELEYVLDSLSNEDLLTKGSAVTSAVAQNDALRHICEQMANTHREHYQSLLQLLQQHNRTH